MTAPDAPRADAAEFHTEGSHAAYEFAIPTAAIPAMLAVVAAAVACRHAYDYAHGPEDDAWIDLRRAVDAYEAASGGRG